MSTIAVQVGWWRWRRGFTRADLATRTGVPERELQDLERGRATGISFATLARLCAVLVCTPADLLELSEDGHVVPILGGPDEDEIIAERLAALDDDGALQRLLADPDAGARAAEHDSGR